MMFVPKRNIKYENKGVIFFCTLIIGTYLLLNVSSNTYPYN